MPSTSIEQLKVKLLELSYIKSALALLSWDQEVNMPPKGASGRAQTLAFMSGLLHEMFLSPEVEKLLLASKNEKLDEKEAAIVREVERELSIEKKFPAEFVKEMAELTSKSQMAWVQARAKSDFNLFQPYLKKMVEMSRKTAGFIGYKDTPYDALLNLFEPYETTANISRRLEELRDFLVPFLEKIKNSKVKPDPKILEGSFLKEKQKEFNKVVIEKLGFSFEAGRIDESTHPFATQFYTEDIRITTRYEEKNALSSLTGSIHESGHGMYEQGMLTENFGTPLAEAVSLGIHESQSRTWENLVARSRSFWQYFYPQLQDRFPEPFKKLPLEDFYKAFNAVAPSLIRVEADEVTYNLHIIIRFEIEKDLIEGKIEVEQLPQIWNEKVKKYLGLETPSDAMGVLQDVHWSMGMFGYFPTYTLGNLYSAQFFNTARKEIPNLEEQFSQGDFSKFRNWLREKIHIHGRLYSAETLCQNITGESLNAKYFINYLTQKYSEIYEL